ncbi:hypothetical protein [Candidatus Odyssella thessalonicensis]|uniref:hypothetical protein n=1 Tax=Candidatus Odyssella thessalonicensis TaxID=84647 RepID=UPI000225AE9A|nr:hypothetical protein [Candidatus Odyssella thessalonicensis]
MTPTKVKLITGILVAHSMMGQIFASDNESPAEREALPEQTSLEVAPGRASAEATTLPVSQQASGPLGLDSNYDEIREMVAKARRSEANTLVILKNIVEALQERNEQQDHLVQNLTALLARSTPAPQNPSPKE